MGKQEVKLILDDTGDNRVLYVRKKDGTEYKITVFEGSGYYTALWLRTKKEIQDGNKKREENDAKWLADPKAKDEAKKVQGLAKLIMFVQRRNK